MGGGFGGQQQQGGFGGGFGGQQGFGGGFGGQQGFGGGFGGQQGGFGGGGGYQPSRQRFNPMQQQQGFGGGFGGQMQGFGGGFGMPQQQQGFGNTFARTMPPQQGFGPDVNNYARPMRDPMRPMVSFPAPQQANPMQQMGGPQPSQQERQYNQQVNAISQNMLQQYGGDQSNPAYQAAMQAQDQQLRGQFGIPQSVAAQPGSLTAAPQDFNQMREAQAAALQSRGMPQSEGGLDADMGKYNQISAERNMAARAAQANQPPASMENLASALRGMGGLLGGGSQSVLGQPGGNIIGRGPHEMPPANPYTQQIRQEDPRMQAMRMMQRMNFGGGGGYNF
jgi:hypothetical protein